MQAKGLRRHRRRSSHCARVWAFFSRRRPMPKRICMSSTKFGKRSNSRFSRFVGVLGWLELVTARLGVRFWRATTSFGVGGSRLQTQGSQRNWQPWAGLPQRRRRWKTGWEEIGRMGRMRRMATENRMGAYGRSFGLDHIYLRFRSGLAIQRSPQTPRLRSAS